MTEPRWLDDAEQRAWRGYLQMHAQLTARLHRQLQADSGLSHSDYQVLVHLTEVPDGRIRPFALQQALEWEQSRLSHQLSRMQRSGLVARQACPDDRRGAFIVLTDAGRKAIEAAAPGHVAAVRRLFLDRLSRDQITMLEQLSTAVLSGLNATGDGRDAGSPDDPDDPGELGRSS